MTTSIVDKYERYGPGAKLLFKCGWNEGQRLGKFGEGISNPLNVSKRQDRVGLGAEKKTIWNDLWWERYLSEALAKNSETKNASLLTESDGSKESRSKKRKEKDNKSGKDPKKISKKKKKTSERSKSKKKKTLDC
eukprot:jgi/Galph1/4365/GphlegSOOS_G3005.1